MDSWWWFQNGDKNNLALRCSEFAQMGYVTVTINYRLSRDYTNNIMDAISDATEDARSAVDWLRENASEYKIDTENIFVGGSSAGGITALHLGYENTKWDKTGIIDYLFKIFFSCINNNSFWFSINCDYCLFLI